MFIESMTPYERMRSLYETGHADRPGVAVIATGFIPRMTGNLTIGECYKHPVKFAKAFLRVQEMLGFDVGPQFGHPASGAMEFGGTLTYPRGDSDHPFPIITQFPVNSIDDLDRLEVPDPSHAGEIPQQIEGAKYVMKHFPRGYRNPMLVIGDPFTWAGNIVGLDTLILWLHIQPELVDELLKKVVEFEVEIARYALSQVSDMIFFDGAPSSSNDLITAKQFEQFALPSLISYREKAMAAGASVFISHPCGNQRKNLIHWKKVPGTRGSLFDFRSPIENCVEKFGNDMLIAGNIVTFQFIQGEQDWIYNEAKEKLTSIASRSPRGFMVGPGCELPPTSSPLNVHALVRAARDYAETPEWREHRK